MKRLPVLAAVVLLSSIGGQAAAQSTQQTIDRALAPLSAQAREGATVVSWNADYTWETLKEGTGTWVCYDRSNDPGTQPFDVQCTSRANLRRVAQNRRFAVEAPDRNARSAMVAAAAENGTRVDAEYGSMWMSMRGQSQATAGIHTTIAVPFATSESTGLPDNPRSGGAYVMAAGTSEAHVMVPGR